MKDLIGWLLLAALCAIVAVVIYMLPGEGEE